MTPLLLLFASSAAQAASFTLISRARNSRSLAYHAIAAVASNVLWLATLRLVVARLDDLAACAAYVAGSVAGGVVMHWIALHRIERKAEEPGAAWARGLNEGLARCDARAERAEARVRAIWTALRLCVAEAEEEGGLSQATLDAAKVALAGETQPKEAT